MIRLEKFSRAHGQTGQQRKQGNNLMNIREPSNGRNRATYQEAIDRTLAGAGKFMEMNPFWAQRMSVRVRWYGRQSGYLAQAGYTDPNSGGFTPVASSFSKPAED